jgi:bifunctional non-homologous end joining protein LigD
MLRQEVVIGGHIAPCGSQKLLGVLLVGVYDGGVLRYVGHVGGGFDRQSLAQVYSQLRRPMCP